MKKFENRITQETPNKMKKMKSLWIDDMDKEMIGNTPYGLFALSLNPNQYVDEVELERKFSSILTPPLYISAELFGARYTDWKEVLSVMVALLKENCDSILFISNFITPTDK